MNQNNTLPIGLSNLAAIHSFGFSFVDKTDRIARLAAHRGIFLFTRPRRFGKSTTLSALAELFAHGTEKLQGLKAARLNLWQERRYTVISLDFTEFDSSVRGTDFKAEFADYICTEFEDAGLELPPEDTVEAPFSALDEALAQAPQQEYVLLVDEADRPYNEAEDAEPQELKARKDLYQRFLSVIAANESKFRFVLFTGITSILPDVDLPPIPALKDLSFDPECNALAGFTLAEIKENFEPFLTAAAESLNQQTGSDRWTAELVLQEFEQHYGHWCFCPQAPERLYCPWDILNFLLSPEPTFGSCWLTTGGGEKHLLYRLCAQQSSNTTVLGFLGDFLNPNCTLRASQKQLSCSIKVKQDAAYPALPLLYQCGYLTIKGGDEQCLQLGPATTEIRRYFAALVHSQYAVKGVGLLVSCSVRQQDLAAGLKQRSFQLLQKSCNILLRIFRLTSSPEVLHAALGISAALRAQFCRDALYLSAVLQELNCLPGPAGCP
ncbi:MAG: AAA family ATPase [Proteobacteria bacterium]|uniref:AAA family ATPase n=1 Tax=Candidatus Avisuccinivibrio stercorigallinarum TaxID=2840704 RepID=A0A9D9DA56_9GAMM|nr:AAA family ATPase [Candidatus Avisuccinivibrio stercorigallinarum]